MKRVVQFAKIDFWKSKPLLMMGIFPLCALFLCIRSANDNALFAASYCIFGGVVSASIPFQVMREHEIGFVQMLPARPGDSVRGHFLYAAGALLYGAAAGGLAALIGYAVQPQTTTGIETAVGSGLIPAAGAPADTLAPAGFAQVLLIALSLAFVITALQSVLLSAYRFDAARGMQILRLVPAFVFLFGVNYASGNAELAGAVNRFLTGPGLWLLPAAALVIFIAAMEAAVRLWER